MSRIKIDMPAEFSFEATIPIRITDMNYGGHAGNDSILSLIHEARIQFLASLGYTEMEFAGSGMIMADVGIEFKNELFYGDKLYAYLAVSLSSKVGFDIYYKLEKESDGKRTTVALAKTGMICYDYQKKKIMSIPQEAIAKLKQL